MKKISILFMVFFLASCSVLQVPDYDDFSYNQTKDLRDLTLEVMSYADNSYYDYYQYVEIIENELIDQNEYEQRRKHNQQVIRIWSIIVNPDKNMVFGFFELWRNEESLSPVFIQEAKWNVRDAFDELIEIERARR